MPAQPAMSEERVKRIEITLDSDGKPQLAKGQLCVEIDRSKDEEVLWVLTARFGLISRMFRRSTKINSTRHSARAGSFVEECYRAAFACTNTRSR